MCVAGDRVYGDQLTDQAVHFGRHSGSVCGGKQCILPHQRASSHGRGVQRVSHLSLQQFC